MTERDLVRIRENVLVNDYRHPIAGRIVTE